MWQLLQWQSHALFIYYHTEKNQWELVMNIDKSLLWELINKQNPSVCPAGMPSEVMSIEEHKDRIHSYESLSYMWKTK